MSRLLLVIVSVCCWVLASTTICYAGNLGVRGAIYTIVEPDMLTMIYQRLNQLQKSGALAAQQKQMQKNSLAHMLRPTVVSGVSDLAPGAPATSRMMDPSIVLNRDITDNQGRIIARKGTRINPLAHQAFDEIFIFIDADNTAQMAWVKGEIIKLNKQNKQYKIVLVRGNIKQSATALNHRIYFDQQGVLCHRFGIKHTPTLLYQPTIKGKRLLKLMVREVQVA